MERRIRVPEGMLKAAREGLGHGAGLVDSIQMHIILEAAIRWLAENPQRLTVEMRDQLFNEFRASNGTGHYEWAAWLCNEFQRRMFLAPEPEVPEAVKDLLWSISGDKEDHEHNAAVIEAYKRGRESK